MLYRQMPPHIQQQQQRYLGERVQDYEDGSGYQFISFDVVPGGQEITDFIRVEF